MAADNGEHSIEVLSKANAALSILEEGRECSAQYLAERTEEPLSSTYRLLASLISVDLVAKGSTRGLYRLGFLPLRIGSMLEDQLDIRALALPGMRSLSDNFEASVLLWVRRGDRAVCIERATCRDIRTAGARIGDSVPLWSDAAGLALLSFLPQAEISDVARGLRHWGETPVGLDKRIDEVRARGYSMHDGQALKGEVSVGAPIFNHRHELSAAITLSTLRRRLDDEDGVIDAVLHAAKEIDAALGGRVESAG